MKKFILALIFSLISFSAFAGTCSVSSVEAIKTLQDSAVKVLGHTVHAKIYTGKAAASIAKTASDLGAPGDFSALTKVYVYHTDDYPRDMYLVVNGDCAVSKFGVDIDVSKQLLEMALGRPA